MRVRERFANVFLRLYQSNAAWIVAWVMFVLIAAVVFSSMFWCWLSAGESGSTAIRNLGLVVAAIIALPLAIWRSIVAERQAATAQRQSETAQRGLLNERYQKGAEMLGSDLLAVRLGGIYALARLARDHPGNYHTQIMSLFCAFVHHHPAVEKENKENQDTEQDPEESREDFRGIIKVIVARSTAQIEIEKEEKYKLDLSGLNLSGAYLTSANLVNADLIWANLNGAILVEANLANANLIGTILSGAKLMKCKGLTQEQLNQVALRKKEEQPDLTDAVDANTGKPLVWHGAPLGG